MEDVRSDVIVTGASDWPTYIKDNFKNLNNGRDVNQQPPQPLQSQQHQPQQSYNHHHKTKYQSMAAGSKTSNMRRSMDNLLKVVDPTATTTTTAAQLRSPQSGSPSLLHHKQHGGGSAPHQNHHLLQLQQQQHYQQHHKQLQQQHSFGGRAFQVSNRSSDMDSPFVRFVVFVACCRLWTRIGLGQSVHTIIIIINGINNRDFALGKSVDANRIHVAIASNRMGHWVSDWHKLVLRVCESGGNATLGCVSAPRVHMERCAVRSSEMCRRASERRAPRVFA